MDNQPTRYVATETPRLVHLFIEAHRTGQTVRMDNIEYHVKHTGTEQKGTSLEFRFTLDPVQSLKSTHDVDLRSMEQR